MQQPRLSSVGSARDRRKLADWGQLRCRLDLVQPRLVGPTGISARLNGTLTVPQRQSHGKGRVVHLQTAPRPSPTTRCGAWATPRRGPTTPRSAAGESDYYNNRLRACRRPLSAYGVQFHHPPNMGRRSLLTCPHNDALRHAAWLRAASPTARCSTRATPTATGPPGSGTSTATSRLMTGRPRRSRLTGSGTCRSEGRGRPVDLWNTFFDCMLTS